MTTMQPMRTMDLARNEREDLLAFLETLAPEQWQHPSLCRGWRVHDVVAHILSYDELGPRALLQRFAAGRFTTDRTNAVGLAAYRNRSSGELMDLLRAHLTPSGLTAALGGRIGLTDALIHHQDIRRPLDKSRDIPAERLTTALQTALFAPVVRGVLRVRDVRLIATDLDWSFGRGPEVHGPAESLLMTIAGRRGIHTELSGPGVTRLARRDAP